MDIIRMVRLVRASHLRADEPPATFYSPSLFGHTVDQKDCVQNQRSRWNIGPPEQHAFSEAALATSSMRTSGAWIVLPALALPAPAGARRSNQGPPFIP